MVASICGVSVDQTLLPMLRRVRNRAKEVGVPATIATLMGTIGALAYKVAGAVISLFTGGNLTLVGAVFVSSPYFYIPLALIAAISVSCFVTTKICTSLIHQIHRS